MVHRVLRSATEARPALAAVLALGVLGGCEQMPVDEAPDAFRIRRDAALDAPIPDAGPAPICPPAAPFGTEVGDRLGQATLFDCEGNAVTLHSLCETDVVWLWQLAEWCSPCRTFAAGPYDEISSRYEAMYGERFASMAIITADAELNLPTPEICQELRDRYAIDGPLYFDPDNTFRDLIGQGFSNDVHAIVTRGMVLRWTMQFGSDFVDGQLQATFDALESGSEVPDADVRLDAGPLEDAAPGADAP